MQNNQSTTSLHTTAFNQDFEAQVNSNMNPITSSSRQDQKGPLPIASPDLEQANDVDFNEKMAMKDQGHHDLPPRFSTIFDTKLPAKLEVPSTPTRAFESYPQQPTRKSGGVYIAKPLFWALFAIFMLESATLFAYTIVGLVNNMQSQLIHTNGAGSVVAGCDCNSQPINISPNFYMAPQASSIETTTLSTTITPSTSSSTTSASTISSSTSIDVSRIADLIKSAVTKTSTSSTHTPTTRVVVITPPGPTISSTTVLIVDPSGNTISPVTSTKIVGPDGAEPTLNTRDESTPIVSTSSSSGPGITITPVVVTTASDGSLVSVSIGPTTTSTTVVANKSTQDSEPESSNISSPTTTTVMVPFATKEGGVGTPESVFMAPIQSPTSNVLPSMILSLKSHGELANKPTQDAESSPSSTATSVSTTTTSSSSSSPSSSSTSTTTSSSSSSSTTPTPTITTTTSAPTPEVISTFTITGPTSTLSAAKAKASCDHKKILGVNAIGCSLPADALDHPGEVIGDIFGGIGK